MWSSQPNAPVRGHLETPEDFADRQRAYRKHMRHLEAHVDDLIDAARDRAIEEARDLKEGYSDPLD